MTENPRLHAALQYATMGVRVFPIAPRGKVPLTRNGHRDASLREERIRGWWERRPEANVGVVAGDGLAVLDVDPDKGGLDSLAELVSEHGKTSTFVVRTGSGGFHLYFQDDPADPLPQSAGRIGPGLDIRAGGKGYVVGVGSTHPNGQPYTIYEARKLAPVPDWLRQLAREAKSQVAELATSGAPIEAGARNEALASLAGSLRRRGLSQAAIRAALLEENAGRCRPPLEEYEVEAIAESVSRYRADEPYAGGPDPTEEFEADPEARPAPGAPSPSNAPLYSDEWMVDQVVDQYKEVARYSPVAKYWYTWQDGHVWARDERLHAESLLRDLLRHESVLLRQRAAAAPTKGEAKPAKAAATRFQSKAGIGSVESLLQARVAVGPSDFDGDPWLLNTPAGVVDLRTGELHEPGHGGLHSRATGVAPAPGPTPLWRRFLADLTGADAEFIRYLQKTAGLCLTGDVSEKTLWFVWGSDSDTGKSTFIRALAGILGTYADSVDVGAFINSGNRSDTNNHALASLDGVRLVTATEPSAGEAWDDRRIKAITGGDEIAARYLYGQWFTYQPQFKIMIVGNHEPELKVVDDAMLRRLHIVPFNRKVPRERQIENLSDRLVQEEGPQILHWLIQGCLAWQDEGLGFPTQVAEKTEAYRAAEDTLAQWVRECCELAPEYEASRRDLFTSWDQWCRSRGEDPGSFKTFKRKIEEADLELEDRQVGDRRLAGYRGIRLSPIDLENI